MGWRGLGVGGGTRGAVAEDKPVVKSPPAGLQQRKGRARNAPSMIGGKALPPPPTPAHSFAARCPHRGAQGQPVHRLFGEGVEGDVLEGDGAPGAGVSGRRLASVGKIFGGGYCRLKLPLGRAVGSQGHAPPFLWITRHEATRSPNKRHISNAPDNSELCDCAQVDYWGRYRGTPCPQMPPPAPTTPCTTGPGEEARGGGMCALGVV